MTGPGTAARLVLDLLLIGLAITFEPFPLIGFILILSAEKGMAKGAAFILGWFACLAAIITSVMIVSGGQPPAASTAPSTGTDIAKMVIGAGLIGFGIWQWRRRGRPRKTPSWMAKVDTLSLWTVALLAVFLQPWGLVAAGAATVINASLSTWEDYLTLAGFCLIASASFVCLELLAVLRPADAESRLERMRLWLDRHQAVVIVIAVLLIGSLLLGKSVYYLVTA